MGSRQMTHNAGFYVALGVEALAIFVLLGLVIVGIIIAVRAKTGTGQGLRHCDGSGLCIAILLGRMLVPVQHRCQSGVELAESSWSDAGYSSQRQFLRDLRTRVVVE